MKQPAYAAGLHEKTFCRSCRCDRFIATLTSWEPCDGGGPHRRVQCGSCGSEFTEWRGCMHQDGDFDCKIQQRRNGLLDDKPTS